MGFSRDGLVGDRPFVMWREKAERDFEASVRFEMKRRPGWDRKWIEQHMVTPPAATQCEGCGAWNIAECDYCGRPK